MHFVTPSPCHLVTLSSPLSPCHLVTLSSPLSPCHLVTLSSPEQVTLSFPMNHPIIQLGRFLYHPTTLYVAAWTLALSMGAGRWLNARFGFEKPERMDGNHGHTTIDFGAQWLMGRMITSGHGQELYQLNVAREVAYAAYCSEPNSREQGIEDADGIIGHFLRPEGGDEIGGMLYPPVQALMMAPFALGDHPQRSYFVIQWVMLGYCFLGGLGIRILSRGRIWWPLGSALILAFPGCKGGIDLGQNSTMTLMILIWGWAMIVHGYSIVGGIIWGLLAFKPVWAASFILALMVLRQWRAAMAMAAMGAFMVLLTLPFVGIHSWVHWFKIGQLGAADYNVDPNWIPLSRDLLGMPRRLFIDFHLPYGQRDNLLARALSVALWLVVFELTIRIFYLRRDRSIPLIGPVPAFVFFAAWMCTYHFMYYDSLIALFPLVVLLADPRPFLQRTRLKVGNDRDPATSLRPRTFIYLNSFVLTLLGMILFHENIVRHLNLEATVIARPHTTTNASPDGMIETPPRLEIGTSDRYPWETGAIIILWMWCGGMVLWTRAAPPRDPHL